MARPVRDALSTVERFFQYSLLGLLENLARMDRWQSVLSLHDLAILPI